MANVQFLRGSSSALSTLKAPEDGVFYLTTDTHKLNVGLLVDGTTTVYELNKDITVFPNLATLKAQTRIPKKGSFFYLEEENIFCVYTGNGYLQINPDTGVTGIDDTRSTDADNDGIVMANQPITSVSYNSTTRKLVVNSGDKFVNLATFKQLKAVVEANRIIGGVSSEFKITNDDEKILSIDKIDLAKITGLNDALLGKVDKKTSIITDDNGLPKEVEWTLLSPTDQSKLAALVLGENGEGVEISGKVNASNVDGLGDWITTNRDNIAGLFSTASALKLAGIENNAQVNIIESVKVNNSALSITDKSVNIPIASQLFPGVVLSSLGENHISVDSAGLMSVNSLNINRLTQTEGDVLIMDGSNINT